MNYNLIFNCLLLAEDIHKGQVYHFPGGDLPYIQHPLRVATRVIEFVDKLPGLIGKLPVAETEPLVTFAVCSALLHDVLEDSHNEHLLDDLDYIPSEIVRTVKRLSHNKQQDAYSTYIARLAPYPLARLIKQQDLIENLSNRCENTAASLMTRYEKALNFLTGLDLVYEQYFGASATLSLAVDGL